MANAKSRNGRKILAVLGIVSAFAIGFVLLGMFIDFQIILRYDFTPIRFTFAFLFVGALLGFLLALRTIRHMSGDGGPSNQ